MKPGRPRKPGPKKTVLAKILLTPELDAAFTAAAEQEAHTVSSLGRAMIEIFTGEIPKLAKRADMTPLEWLRHVVRHNETPVDQSPAAQRRRMNESLGED